MKMRRLLICISIFALLFAPFAFAEKAGNPKNKSKAPAAEGKDNKGEGKPEEIQSNQPKIHKNMTKEEKKLVIEEIKNRSIEKKQMLELQLQNISNRDNKRYSETRTRSGRL